MTTSFKSQSAQRPTAMGTLLQNSAYGSTIPVGYGLTQSNLLAIWAANLRQGGGNTKKFKQAKKGITNYCECIDFLIGHNPVRGVIQVMNNGSNTPVVYTSASFSSAGGRQSFTVSDPHFYFVIGVTVSASYSYSVDDYGGQGPQTLTGTFEIPLWNELETGPDPTDPTSYRCWPYCYRWQQGMGATLYVDAESFPTGTVKVYYAQLIAATSYQPPITKLALAFEPQLGSGDEYANGFNPGQQIIYPQFAGLQSSEINLGASGALPQLNPEVAWKWGVYPSGDADFADMIEDIYKSGLAQAAIAADTSAQPTPATTQMERGLSSYQMPGTIQKKVDQSATASLPPMQYDMPNAPGNFLMVVVTAAGTLSIASTNGETWTPVYGAGLGYQVWYSSAAGGPNTVTVTGSSGAWEMGIIEVGGTGGSVPGEINAFATTNASSFHVGADTNTASAVSDNNSCALAITGVYPPLRLFQEADAEASWGGFSMPGLPAGATVTAIQPVVTYDFQDFGPDAVTFLIGGLVGFPGVPGSGTWVGASIGTTSADVTAFAPSFEIIRTLRLSNYSATFSVSAIYLKISYTGPSGGLGGEILDAVAVSSNGPATAASSVAEGLPGYLLGVSLYPGGSAPAAADEALWNAVTPANFYSNSPGTFQVQDRVIYSPGEYSAAGAGGSPASVALIVLKAVQPVNYPRPLGDFIDVPSLNQTRSQCRAGGLWGSLTMNSQSSASDWLKSLCMAANCAPVFLGSKLYLIPYSEVSAAGNGALYTAPTAAGPVANLNADNGDFVGSAGEGCPRLETSDRVGQPNVLQMQFIDRNANYTQTTAQVTDPASIGLYCVRKADPITMNCVQDPTVARTLLGIQVRRNSYGGDTWFFTASARWSLLSPMDLVTLTDTLQDLAGVPVRITKFNEQDDGSFVGEAEPFVYGMSSPIALETTGSNPNSNDVNASAGDVNPPIIFEPTPGLFPGLLGPQLWLVISSSSANFGGAQVFISTDGGSSYNPAPGGPGADNNVAMGNAITGVLTADWPAGTDPDSTNNLLLDLTESKGTLQSFPTVIEDNFEFPCYVQSKTVTIDVGGVATAEGAPVEVEDGGILFGAIGTLEVGGVAVADDGSDGFGYELMSYAVATLTGTDLYTLQATGAGNYLRRAILKAPNNTGNGVDHPINSRFALLNQSNAGTLKINLPSQYIGQQVLFKVLSFNTFGTALQSLADVPAYAYTPTGIPGSV